MTTTHHLKTHPAPLADVERGVKTFEIRSTKDRTFAVGDVLVLEEWDPYIYEDEWRMEERHLIGNPIDNETAWNMAHERATKAAYTGRSVRRTVTYIFAPEGNERYGLQPGYVVLGLSAGGQPL